MTDLDTAPEALDAAPFVPSYAVDAQGRRIFLIPADRIGDFTARMDTLSKRARRLKIGTAAFTVGKIACVESVKITDWDGETRFVRVDFLPVVLEGGAPIRAAGWEFIARLERLGDENLVHVRPGVNAEIVDRYKTSGAACEHCNTIRNRKDTYVVRHDDGRQMQIGATCLRDFLGCDSPAGLAAKFEWFTQAADAASGFAGEGYIAPECTLETMLAVAATVIRVKGFASRARVQAFYEAGGHGLSTTSSIVSTALWGTSDEAVAERRWIKAASRPEDRAQAQEAIAYWAGMVAPDGDYERNLSLLCRQDVAKARHAGLLVSAIPSWARAKGLTLGPVVEKRESQHVGKVGERLRGLVATVTMRRGFDGDWGGSVLVKMIDDDGNVLTWFASNSADFALNARVRFDATVKAHKEHKGAKETQLTRATFKAVVAPAATPDPVASTEHIAPFADAPADPAPAAPAAPSTDDARAEARKAAARKAWDTRRARETAAAA